MNTGQMLITVGAIMLLSLLILRVNNNFFATSSVMLETKFNVMAISLGTSLIEEATSKAFDHYTDTISVSDVTDLTTPGSLGPESGEPYPNFDDFDDYNGFSKIVASDTMSVIRHYGVSDPSYKQIDSTMKSAIFKISCIVDYVTPSNPNITSASRTWHKRLRVTITSPMFHDELGYAKRDTIRLSTIFSYWYFR